MIKDWIAFWDSPHSIYVNARHKDVHYRLIAEQIAALAPPGGQAQVLDYGCGEALHADLVSAVVGELLLCEAAPKVRAGLEKRFADDPKIRVVAPHDVARLPDESCDLVILHSVVQYLTPTGTAALFAIFRRLIKPDGLFVVSDVIQPKVAAAADAIALLQFGKANGFFLAGCWGLVRTAFSDYWRLRGELGLTRYAEAAMIEKLDAAGFKAERAPSNIGHNQARMTFYARRL